MHFWGTAARRAAIDTLESRELLSVTIDAKKRSITVTGSSAADDISIRAHRNLINVIDVVIRNKTGRAQTFVSTAVARTINVVAGDGDDKIAIDNSLRGLAGDASVWIDAGAGDDTIEQCVLGGTIKMGAGDDRVKVATTADTLYLYGGAGDDHLELAGGAHSIYGDDGNDAITLGEGASTVRGGAGDDRISVGKRFGRVEGNAGDDTIDAGAVSAASVLGGDGDDRITLDPVVGPYPGVLPTTVLGGGGDDTIVGSESSTVLFGGDGDDVLRAGGFASGDAGDDVLDGRGSSFATLHGGNGDDDLYAGTTTEAFGELGHDSFDDGDGFFSFTDFDARADKGGGTARLPSGSGGSYNNLHGDPPVVGSYHSLHLEPLEDVGFLVAENDRPGRSVGTLEAYTAYSHVAEYPNTVAVLVPRDVRPSPTLTKDERKGLRLGVVRLPAGWQLANPKVKQDGYVWYDTRFGKGGERAKSDEFGTVYQLCVKAGTVLVTSDGSYTNKATHLGRGRADVAAMWLPAGATAQIAGDSATTYVVADAAPQAAVKAKAHQRGILVEGGVLWLPFDGEGSRLSALKFA